MGNEREAWEGLCTPQNRGEVTEAPRGWEGRREGGKGDLSCNPAGLEHTKASPRCAHTGENQFWGGRWDFLNVGVFVLCCSRDSDLSTIISNLHQSRQLVMPETQSRCEFKRNTLDVGLAAAGEAGAPPAALRLCFPSSPFRSPVRSFSCCFFCLCYTLAVGRFLIFWLKMNMERISWWC